MSRTFTTVGTESFKVPARPPIIQPTSAVEVAASKGDNSSGGNTGCITVKVKGDKNADETSWLILNKNGNQVAVSPALKQLTPVSKKVCLPSGQYEFVMKDEL